MRHVYLIEDGERHWVAAESFERAAEVYAESIGYTPDQYRDECSPETTQLNDNAVLRVYLDHPYREPSPFIEKTCREWAEQGDSVIATTCF